MATCPLRDEPLNMVPSCLLYSHSCGSYEPCHLPIANIIFQIIDVRIWRTHCREASGQKYYLSPMDQMLMPFFVGKKTGTPLRILSKISLSATIKAAAGPSNSVSALPGDPLALQSHGSNGLTELKQNVGDLTQAFIAFYREDIRGNPGYLLINYLRSPYQLSSAVSRQYLEAASLKTQQRCRYSARILVYSRRLGTVFTVRGHCSFVRWRLIVLSLKARQTTLTIDNLGNLTQHAIIQALTHIDTPTIIPTARSPSESSAWSTDRNQLSYDMPDSPSTSTDESARSPPASPIAKTAGKISRFLGRGKRHGSMDSSPALPSPTGANFHRERLNSLSEFGIYPHGNEHQQSTFIPTQSLPSKWVAKVTVRDPSELLKQRREAQRMKAIEMERAKSEEAEIQAQRARQREEARRLEREEEGRNDERWRKRCGVSGQLSSRNSNWRG
ncbi:enoyl- hydratase carnithine racemase [Salix suchowensis]|nr:enoyl- hydratase carnithine racemase [Salix suchowensis]